MKDNNNSSSESEDEENNKIDFFLKEKLSLNSTINEQKNLNEEEKEEDKIENNIENNIRNNIENNIENNIDINKFKLGKKIICPENNCFSNAIISINPISFEVRTNCGKHKKNMDILTFVEKSGQSKEEKESCSICNDSHKDILQNNKKLYKCFCGLNICETCKDNHLKEKDPNEHNMVDFNKKDYLCCCTKDLKNYISFCITCNKNLCIVCDNFHKGHKVQKFSELFKMGKEDIKKITKSLDEKKQKIAKIKSIIDNWLVKTKIFFEVYKKKLDIYLEINNLIFNKIDVCKKYYQEIKNVENMRDGFDDKILDLLKYEKDFKKQNEIIAKLINENEDYKNNNKKIINSIKEKNIYEYTFNKLFEKVYEKETVINICELKKDNLLVVNTRGPNQEILHIYIKSDTNFYNKELFWKIIDGGKIMSMSELKNGNLLIVQENYFKILKIQIGKKQINMIQNQKLDVEKFKQIIELINGNLVSISYIPNKENYIDIWERNLMSDKFEKKINNHLEKEPQFLKEINNYLFLVYFQDERISIFNSELNMEIKELPKINLINDNYPKYRLINVVKINEGNLLFVYQNGVLIYNLLLNKYTKIFITKPNLIKDICHTPDDDNIFLMSLYEQPKTEQNHKPFFGIVPLYSNLFLQKIYLGHNISNIHNKAVLCIKMLCNGNIITGSLDNSLKIWTIKKK